MARHINILAFRKCCRKFYLEKCCKILLPWVEGCENCAKAKRVPNNALAPEMPNLPECDLGPEDAMQTYLFPNLPTSGGYQTLTTAIDVFSRYLFAYPLIEATAANVAKMIFDIMTEHSFLPTTLITDKGSAFTSTIVAEVFKIWGSHSNALLQTPADNW